MIDTRVLLYGVYTLIKRPLNIELIEIIGVNLNPIGPISLVASNMYHQIQTAVLWTNTKNVTTANRLRPIYIELCLQTTKTLQIAKQTNMQLRSRKTSFKNHTRHLRMQRNKYQNLFARLQQDMTAGIFYLCC